MTTPPATEPDPKPDGLEPRVAKLEQGQESILGKLDQLLSRDAPAEPVTTADPVPPADMGEQMRQAVRDVHAETAAASKPDPPKPEVPPREAGQPAKARVQRLLFGKEPK